MSINFITVNYISAFTLLLFWFTLKTLIHKGLFMKFNLPTALLFSSITFLTACQSTPSTDSSPEIQTASSKQEVNHSIPLALAVQVRYEDEVTLLKITQVLTEKKDLTDNERARLFYERGIIYDRMGLSAHSRYDFTQAINIDPTFAEPYNLLGVYLLLVQEFDEAFDAFDSALELSADMHYSHLHRAIGLYLAKRHELASRDIEIFYALDKTDPYRILWRYIINSQLNKTKSINDLIAVQPATTDKRFAWGIVDVVAGRQTEGQFLNNISVGITSNVELAQRLCEAYFYLGHWHKMSGNLKKAVYYFKLSVATNVHDFVEYKYSLMELASIQIMLQKKMAKKAN